MTSSFAGFGAQPRFSFFTGDALKQTSSFAGFGAQRQKGVWGNPFPQSNKDLIRIILHN